MTLAGLAPLSRKAFLALALPRRHARATVLAEEATVGGAGDLGGPLGGRFLRQPDGIVALDSHHAEAGAHDVARVAGDVGFSFRAAKGERRRLRWLPDTMETKEEDK